MSKRSWATGVAGIVAGVGPLLVLAFLVTSISQDTMRREITNRLITATQLSSPLFVARIKEVVAVLETTAREPGAFGNLETPCGVTEASAQLTYIFVYVRPR